MLVSIVFGLMVDITPSFKNKKQSYRNNADCKKEN